jgi:hypothetical protein
MELDLYNFGLAATTGTYAILNRYSSLRKHMSKAVGEFYIRASPTLEHMICGFATVKGAEAFANTPILTQALAEIKPEIQFDDFKHIYAANTIALDFVWEGHQAIERKKILPEQFIGTCVGVALGYLI